MAATCRLVLAAAACCQLIAPAACLSLSSPRKPGGDFRRLGSEGGSKRATSCDLQKRRAHAHMSPARCSPCKLRDDSAPRLWMQETNDGFGSRLHNMLAAMAFASKHGMNIGGIVSYIQCDYEDHVDRQHGEDVAGLLSAILGLADPYDLYTDEAPESAVEFLGVDDLLSNLTVLTPQEDVFLTAKFNNMMAMDLQSNSRRTGDYFTPEFLASLRRKDVLMAQTPLSFKPGRLSVAMHVRRGDIFVNSKAYSRATPNEWYFKVADRLIEKYGEVDIHVFSTTKGTDVNIRGQPGQRWYPTIHSESEFDEFASRGMTLHLDGSSLEAWAHFSKADIFVMAKSEFSWVPALWNEKCVLYQDSWIHPLPSWIRASDGKWLTRTKKAPEFWLEEDRLDACIQDVKAADRAEPAPTPPPQEAISEPVGSVAPPAVAEEQLAGGGGDIDPGQAPEAAQDPAAGLP